VDYTELLTADETAAYLKISKGTVWAWCRTGQLPAIKVGRQWRIRREDLREMIRLGSQGGDARLGETIRGGE
jgi:excisionase family DNA binding protein